MNNIEPVANLGRGQFINLVVQMDESQQLAAVRSWFIVLANQTAEAVYQQSKNLADISAEEIAKGARVIADVSGFSENAKRVGHLFSVTAKQVEAELLQPAFPLETLPNIGEVVLALWHLNANDAATLNRHQK